MQGDLELEPPQLRLKAELLKKQSDLVNRKPVNLRNSKSNRFLVDYPP